MRIGELARRTGVSTRLLRYYESRGLLESERSAAGHRLFAEEAVGRVRAIRELLAAGLPTRTIAELVGCVADPGRLEPCAVPTLQAHVREFDARIAELGATRGALQGLIDASRGPVR